jgi:hypothetical protein
MEEGWDQFVDEIWPDGGGPRPDQHVRVVVTATQMNGLVPVAVDGQAL